MKEIYVEQDIKLSWLKEEMELWHLIEVNNCTITNFTFKTFESELKIINSLTLNEFCIVELSFGMEDCTDEELTGIQLQSHLSKPPQNKSTTDFL